MKGQYLVIIICYLGFMAAIFYLVFIRDVFSARRIKSGKNNKSIVKRIVETLNILADRIGYLLSRSVRKEKISIQTRVLEILEQEKDINITPEAFLARL